MNETLPGDLLAYNHLKRWLKERYGTQVLGVLEIGSRVRDEVVPNSDHDLRLVVNSTHPLLRFDEHAWTQAPDVTTTSVTWEQLNHSDGTSYGLTNLAFIEQSLAEGRYPLIDHTVLYQGRVLVDDYTHSVQQFVIRYMGKRFDNIATDYTAQVNWRTTRKLPAEVEALQEGHGLDPVKHSVAPLHTCCRIVRDMAQINTYRNTGTYLTTYTGLERYAYAHWPHFVTDFHTLFRYKRDAASRRGWFTRVLWGDAQTLDRITTLVYAVTALWQTENT